MSASRPTVLVVDDHDDGARSTALLLELYGYDVRVAGTCRDALREAGSFRPDVILLDIGLPDGDGYDLLGCLRELLGQAPLVVVITAHMHQEERSRRAAVAHHFLKPLDPDVLTGLLRAHTGWRATPGGRDARAGSRSAS